ncbi:hypothetical protein scyTo_0001162 [Scyliorhinus torazame]|uniref:Biogenesis of lysosome-related organelles complex 1 subunit 5 n=1 Tax=Scyliorhinus torazame TaxID=75743 RepID=A0A401PA00_SCYTO|nr:hypothetical protein [Scyliorhinus torazame]
MSSRVEAANHITSRIQQREQEADQDERLHDSRERRKAEWAAFVTDQRRQSSELEEEHAKAAEWLKGQYAAMAKDLAKFRTF